MKNCVEGINSSPQDKTVTRSVDLRLKMKQERKKA